MRASVGLARIHVAGRFPIVCFPTTKRGIEDHARACGWKCESVKGLGGAHFEYDLSNLSLGQQAALIEYLAHKEKPLSAAEGTNFEAGATPANLAVPVAAGTISVVTAAEITAVASGTLDEAKRRYLWERFERKSKARKDEAVRRAAAAVKAIESIKLGWPAMKAYETVAAEFSVSPSALRGWIADVDGFDQSDYAAILIDKREGRPRGSSYPSRVDDLFRAA
jgi:hypothetical protein